MEQRVDLGDIVEIKKCHINNRDTGKSLYKKVSNASVELFIKYYTKLSRGESLPRIPQESSIGDYYSRKLPYNGVINWEWSDRKVYNYCRSLNFPPFKGAVTILNGNEFEILGVKETKLKSNKLPGSIVSTSKDGIIVSTATNDIRINIIKYANAKLTSNMFSDLGLKVNNRFDK